MKLLQTERLDAVALTQWCIGELGWQNNACNFCCALLEGISGRCTGPEEQNNVFVQNDTRPQVAQIAEARHAAAMQQVGVQYHVRLHELRNTSQKSFDTLRQQQSMLASQLAAATISAQEEAHEAGKRRAAADEHLRQTEVRYWCHTRNGHRVLHVMGPTNVFIQDPCPLGLPEILTVAHVMSFDESFITG